MKSYKRSSLKINSKVLLVFEPAKPLRSDLADTTTSTITLTGTGTSHALVKGNKNFL